MTDNVEFAFDVVNTTQGGLQLVVCKARRIVTVIQYQVQRQ